MSEKLASPSTMGEQDRKLFDNLASGLVVHAPDTSILYSNPMAETLLGLSSDQLRGKAATDPYWCFLKEDGSPMPLAEYPVNTVLASGAQLQNHIVGVRRPDRAAPTWVLCNAHPLRNGNSDLEQVIVSFHDITQRKQADETLAFLAHCGATPNEDFFQSLARYLSTCLDMSFVCIDALEGDGLSARTVAVWCDGVFEDNVVYALKDTPGGEVVGKQVCCFPASVCQFFPKDTVLQDLRAQSYVGVTLFGHTGAPIGLIAVIGRTPIIDRELAESTLKLVAGRAAGELERRSAKAEHEQLQAQLLQAQKMEAIGHLAGGIAHDFNNLLQVVLGQVDHVLEEMEPNSPFLAPLRQVEKAGERAAELTRQLLAFGRRQLMQPVNLNLNDLISGMLGMLRRVLGEHLELRFVPGNRLGQVNVDKGQIEQVLMNLCVNAHDAMPNSGTLTIETQHAILDDAYRDSHPFVDQDHYALLSVTDTGCGMNAETQAQIFEPFFTTKGVGKGTGLGLAMVYGIVKQHHGSIEVYSEPGQGTCFKLYLPIAEPAAENVASHQRQPVLGGTETILVAEDEQAVREVLCQILERAGYTVFAAPNGEAALSLFEQHENVIDLALLDVTMPKLGGREVMDHIQARCPRLRFLFSSGYSESAVHTNFVLQRGLRLISKPHRKEALLAAVREVLDADHD